MSEAKSWKEFFENFSYKPNWVFDFREEVLIAGSDRVHITMRVPDSREERSTKKTWVGGTKTTIPLIPVQKTVILTSWSGEERAKDLLRFHIRDMEDHEISEWFRYKGELPFDPHKED